MKYFVTMIPLCVALFVVSCGKPMTTVEQRQKMELALAQAEAGDIVKRTDGKLELIMDKNSSRVALRRFGGPINEEMSIAYAAERITHVYSKRDETGYMIICKDLVTQALPAEARK